MFKNLNDASFGVWFYALSGVASFDYPSCDENYTKCSYNNIDMNFTQIFSDNERANILGMPVTSYNTSYYAQHDLSQLLPDDYWNGHYVVVKISIK